MTRLTHLDLAPFYRNSIGVDRLFDRITSQIDSAATGGNYPPYDIVRTSDDSYEIRVAVAGFSQGEIDVTFHDGQLVITGERQREEPLYEYLHHGISARKFARTFSLADYVEVQSATTKDGILTVYLQRIVPENAKPKKIAITHSTESQ
jgi:molecular chaperone IbpA